MFNIDFTDYENALNAAQEAVCDLKNEAECLKIEMESWISKLECVVDSCDNIQDELD